MFARIYSHSGTNGNCILDAAARQSVDLHPVKNNKVPVTELKSFIENKLSAIWQKKQNEGHKLE